MQEQHLQPPDPPLPELPDGYLPGALLLGGGCQDVRPDRRSGDDAAQRAHPPVDQRSKKGNAGCGRHSGLREGHCFA